MDGLGTNSIKLLGHFNLFLGPTPSNLMVGRLAKHINFLYITFCTIEPLFLLYFLHVVHQSNNKKFALRMCAKSWDSSYQELLHLFSQPDLQRRRLYLDLCRVINGLFHFPDDIFVPQTSNIQEAKNFLRKTKRI